MVQVCIADCQEARERAVLNPLHGQCRSGTCATVGEAKGWQGATLLLPFSGRLGVELHREGQERCFASLSDWIVMLPVALVIESGWDFLLTSKQQMGFLLVSAPWSKTSF